MKLYYKVSAEGTCFDKCDKQHKQFLKELKQFGKKLISDPELARQQLLKAGIVTRTGRLTKNYREDN